MSLGSPGTPKRAPGASYTLNHCEVSTGHGAPGQFWGSAQIGVEIQHKDRLLTDPGTIEDVLAVENDVVPFDRADVLEQGRVDAFLCDSLRAHRLRDLLGLPIDDAGQNQRQAATGVPLLV